VLNKTPPDVPSGVVIAVQLLSALQALKLITITIVFMREPALAMTATLRSVRRGDIVHVDTVFLGLAGVQNS